MRKGEKTRQEIIRRAAPVFNQRGYDGAALQAAMRCSMNRRSMVLRANFSAARKCSQAI